MCAAIPDPDPKSTVEQIYRAFNERNTDALDHLLADDFVDYTAGPSQKPGRIGIKEVWAWIWTKHPEVHISVKDIFTEGDKVASRLTFQVPHEGPDTKVGWMIEIFQISDGKAVALWNMLDLPAGTD